VCVCLCKICIYYCKCLKNNGWEWDCDLIHVSRKDMLEGVRMRMKTMALKYTKETSRKIKGLKSVINKKINKIKHKG